MTAENMDTRSRAMRLLTVDQLCVLLRHALARMRTGKSLSEALIFASSNQQYDHRLFIELQVQYVKIPSSEHVVQNVKTKNNLYTKCTELVIQ